MLTGGGFPAHFRHNNGTELALFNAGIASSRIDCPYTPINAGRAGGVACLGVCVGVLWPLAISSPAPCLNNCKPVHESSKIAELTRNCDFLPSMNERIIRVQLFGLAR